jgi:heme-degrading monooxygenase HmoA
MLADFFDGLDHINALADKADGFVWRLQTEEGNATSLSPYDDELIILNMSVWESLDALKAFVYDTEHRSYLRRRREWFEAPSEAFVCLWWVPAGEIPTMEQAVERLDRFRKEGPTPYAFSFRQTFPPPDGAGETP